MLDVKHLQKRLNIYLIKSCIFKNSLYVCIVKHLNIHTMNTSNLITEKNVAQFKCKVLTLVCPAYGTANLLNEIQTAMNMFQYENESVETIVFDYCFSWHQDKYSI